MTTSFEHYHSNTPTPLTTDHSNLFQRSLLHKWYCAQSILCLVPSPKRRLLFCGTQNSSIIVFDLVTFQKKLELPAHQGSVLCLHLSSCENRLFSAGSDSLVNIWDISDISADSHTDASIELNLLLTVYSLLDIGDIFSLTWVDKINTLFIGAQNASLSFLKIEPQHISTLRTHNAAHGDHNTDVNHINDNWGNHSNTKGARDHTKNIHPSNDHFHLMPSQRFDKFFDSKGSCRLSQSPSSSVCDLSLLPKASSIVQIPFENIIPYAHNGFIYSLEVLADLDPYTSTLGESIAEMYENVLISGGGDGQIKFWGITSDSSLKFLKAVQNPDCILSMTLNQLTLTLYVGLITGDVVSWDLTTFQPLKSWKIDDDDDADDLSNDYTHDVFALTLSPSKDTLYMGTPMGVTKRHIDNSQMDLELTLPIANRFPPVQSQRIGSPPSPLLYNNGQIPNGCIRIATNEPCLCLKTFEAEGESYLVAAGSNKTISLWTTSMPSIFNKNKSQLSLNSSPNLTSVATDNNFSNEKFLKTLAELISFRSVSQEPDLYQDDSRQCANYLTLLLRSLGAVKSELWPVANGNPIVNAIFKANDPTVKDPSRVIWYAHYDVIPASSATWSTLPFQLTPKNGYVYARGATDNKGPLLAAIYAVGELYSKQQLKSDVVFIIEGEEEAGSWGFQNALKENQAKIGDIDWILMSNSYWLGDEVPCLNYGLRGVIRAEVEVISDSPDRHSGVHGGVVGEPSMDLIKVCSSLIEDGNIQIDGFNEDFTKRLPNIKLSDNKLNLTNLDNETVDIIKGLREWERPLYAEIAQRLPQFPIKELIKKWREPALSLHRIEMSGPDNGTVIPKSAKAKISMRLVPGQDLEQVKQSLISHIETEFKNLNGTNHLNVSIVHEAEPWLGDVSNNAYRVLFNALEKEWGVAPIYIREGGSVPAIRCLEKTFSCAAAHLPAGQASDNAHLNDERIRVINLFKVRDVIKTVIQEVNKK